MPRLQNETTKVIVNVDDETAASLPSNVWKPAEEPKQAPARKTAKSDES